MNLTGSLPLSLALLLPGVVFAQDMPEANRISGHFKVGESATSKLPDGTLVDIYLRTGTVYLVRVGGPRGKYFEVKRSDVLSKEFAGGATTFSVTGGTGGAAGILDGNGGGSALDISADAELTLTWTTTMSFDGTIKDGASKKAFKLERRISIPPKNPTAFDAKNPSYSKIGRHIRSAPKYPNTGDYERVFWDAWGPVFYRGRMFRGKKARLLAIASDPGPTEGLPFVRRSLVGDAGQRTQGFLEKLGLTESYVLVNGFTYPTHPSKISQGRKLFNDFPEQLKWRNDFYDLILERNELQGIMIFGGQAETAFKKWNKSRMDRGLPDLKTVLTVVKGPHPSSARGDWDSFASKNLAKGWSAAIDALRKVITPDDKDLALQPNYGMVFSEVDYGEIPPADLPKASQKFPFIRDNSFTRNKNKGTGRRNNSVKRKGSLWMELELVDKSKVYIRAMGENRFNHNLTPKFKTTTEKPAEFN